MSEAPKCKLCGKRHWLSAPHQFDQVAVVAGIPVLAVYDLPPMAELIRYDWDQRERELGLRDA